MSHRPSLARSTPFWGLIVASAASAAAGALMLVDKIGVMSAALTAGTATGIEVYVGQSVAVVGAVLVGAGVVGILLALAIAALSTLRPALPVEVVESPEDAVDEPAVAEDRDERTLDDIEVVEADEKDLTAAR
ncbi:dinucleotide-utilizing enzyme [Microbacterium terricola]|uniref:Dinucleotide-utilizing enzyme n=1 Tax=Microbacterium terricola TaxID=344163 RepID=A0ABM8DY40_9MICO|nr:dinucleotide-utilizing enzyme [Microbacterium terricola]UYK38833.1 dinucleotide-utilizing enzyme [Microbacterium terricola]BDV30471.1 hypothetical protein Microterr_11310 [Microbacterium terricola]